MSSPPIDLGALADFLVKSWPLIAPLLVEGARKTGEGLANRLGEKGAETVWDRIAEGLGHKVKPDSAVKKAGDKLLARPQDQRAQDRLKLELEELLEEDGELAAQLRPLVTIAQGGVNIREHAHVEVGGSIVGRDLVQFYFSSPGVARLTRTEFERILAEYLDWAQKAYSQARLYGLESLRTARGRPVKQLADVFVPLILRRLQPPHREELEALVVDKQDPLAHTRAFLQWKRQQAEQGNEVPLVELLAQSSQLAVVGGAGSGKSTLLAYLASALATSAQTGEPLPFALPHDKPALVPLIIPLRYLREYQRLCHESPQEQLKNPRAGRLAGYVPWYLKRRCPALELSEDFVDRLLLGGGCLVMLDGLDEVVTRQERGRIREQIEELAHDIYRKNHFIVTAREAGYQEDAVFGDDFVRLDVQPLDGDQIQTLVANWTRQLYPAEAEEGAAEIVAAISEINERYVEQDQPPLVSTPLLTTMVVSVKFGKTDLPRERAKLYEAAVEVILQAQYIPNDEARQELVEWGGPWEDQRDWLAHLALEMHRGGRAGAARSETDIRKLLEPVLSGERQNQFIEAVRSRGGLLEERAELFQFIHLTFQEFLAARLMAKQRDAGLPEREKYLTDPWWREVLLLTHGFAKIDFAPFADKYLGWLAAEHHAPQIHLAGLELAGAALLELEKPDPERRREIARQIADVIEQANLQAPAPLRATAANTLARLGDPRPGIISLPPLTGDAFEQSWLWCEIPSGPFQLGNNRETDSEAYEDEMPQLVYDKIKQPYYISRYPITSSQFDAFVQDRENGYDHRPWWTDAGWNWKGERKSNKKYGGVFDLPNHPVVNVSFYEAVAFARWLSEQFHLQHSRLQVWHKDSSPSLVAAPASFTVRLPSEPEWEKAARGIVGGKYPWGGDITPEHANYSDTGLNATSAVGCFPKGASPYGVLDMSGNVWEWCSTMWTGNYEDYRDKEDNELEGESPRVVRGGAFDDAARDVRCAFRYWSYPGGWDWDLGFRVVLSPVRL